MYTHVLFVAEAQNNSSLWQQICDQINASGILNIVGAVAILVIGWIIAALAKKGIKALVARLDFRKWFGNYIPEENIGASDVAGKIAGGITFWGVFLVTILACFSALNLEEAATPIQELLQKALGYVPNLVAGLLLCVVAWIVASVMKFFAIKAVTILKLNEKVEKFNEGKEGEPTKLENPVANTVSVITWLFFLPSILHALEISGITEPLENLFLKALEFVPNLAACAAIVVAGLFFAEFLRRITLSLLTNVKVDSFGEKVGLSGFLGVKSIAKPISIIVYTLIALPVVTAALSALQLDVLADSTTSLLSRILNATGNIFGAALTLFIAYLLGSLACRLTTDLLASLGFNKLFSYLGLAKKPEAGAAESDKPAIFVGKLILVTVMLFGVVSACQLLGFDYLAQLVYSFIPFAGRILLGAIIFLLGISLANFVSGIVEGQNWENKLLKTVIHCIILFFSGALALHSTGIASPIIVNGFVLILGAFAVAFAIAFGWGGKDFAAKKLEEWFSKK